MPYLRLLVGFLLIYASVDEVFFLSSMLDLRDFLAVHGVPVPLFAAYLFTFAQFACGIYFIVGRFTRRAAAVKIARRETRDTDPRIPVSL